MAMKVSEFKACCAFYMKNGKVHGKCAVQMPDGRILHIQTAPHEGVNLSALTYDIARQNGQEVSGFFSSAWKSAKSAASKVATSQVAKTLYSKSKAAVSQAAKMAQTPEAQAALSFVPGGNAVKLGVKAANLIESASRGNVTAKQMIQRVAMQAAKGYPGAIQAQSVLRTVYGMGKSKGLWAQAQRRAASRYPSPPTYPRYTPRGMFAMPGAPYRTPYGILGPAPYAPSASGQRPSWAAQATDMMYQQGLVAGWYYNKPYRGIAFDSPTMKARALYGMALATR